MTDQVALPNDDARHLAYVARAVIAQMPRRGFLRGLAALPLVASPIAVARAPAAFAVLPAIAGDGVADSRLLDLVMQWRVAAKRERQAFEADADAEDRIAVREWPASLLVKSEDWGLLPSFSKAGRRFESRDLECLRTNLLPRLRAIGPKTAHLRWAIKRSTEILGAWDEWKALRALDRAEYEAAMRRSRILGKRCGRFRRSIVKVHAHSVEGLLAKLAVAAADFDDAETELQGLGEQDGASADDVLKSVARDFRRLFPEGSLACPQSPGRTS